MHSASTNSRRRWFQFSLRTLLFLISALSLLFGFCRSLNRAHQQRDAVLAVRAAGGVILYEDQFGADGNFNARAEPAAPEWLRNLLGDDFFRTPAGVDNWNRESSADWFDFNARRELSDASERALCRLPTIKRLNFVGTSLSHGRLLVIESLNQLEELDLTERHLSDEECQQLAKVLSRPDRRPLNSKPSSISSAGSTISGGWTATRRFC